MSEEPPKHLTVFPSETANIKKLANLTANTKNYEQITLNTKPPSDPPKDASNSVKKDVQNITKPCSKVALR